jgi:hypothetical protein
MTILQSFFLAVTKTHKGRPIPLSLDCTYGCQNCHDRQLTNSTFHLVNLYKDGSVFSVRFHRVHHSRALPFISLQNPRKTWNFSIKFPLCDMTGSRYFGLVSPRRFLWVSKCMRNICISLDWSVCLLTIKHLVSLQARVRSSVQTELDLHTAHRWEERDI